MQQCSGIGWIRDQRWMFHMKSHVNGNIPFQANYLKSILPECFSAAFFSLFMKIPHENLGFKMNSNQRIIQRISHVFQEQPSCKRKKNMNSNKLETFKWIMKATIFFFVNEKIVFLFQNWVYYETMDFMSFMINILVVI